MKATSEVLAERELAVLRRGAVREDLALLHLVAPTSGVWLRQVRSLRPFELAQP
jgi:hypothetical protein